MLSENKRKFILSLHLKKNRSAEGLFLAEGFKTIRDLAAGGCVFQEIVCTSRMMDRFDEIPGDFPLIETDEKSFAKISILDSPSGMLGVARMPDLPSVVPSHGRFLILDGVKDPGNMGTIIRTAHWFGCAAIFCIHDCVEIFNPKVVQSTMGSLFAVPCLSLSVSELGDFLRQHPELPLYSADMQGVSVYSHRFPSSFALVLGSESAGLSDAVKSLNPLALTIPPTDMQHRPESLNVAVSAAVILGLSGVVGS